MTELRGGPQPQAVRSMFSRIAKRYDRLNRIMTLGQDRAWRRETIERLELQPSARVLDIGTGTGDLAFEALRQQPDAFVVAADFTPDMVRVGRDRAEGVEPAWVIADSAHLPFADGSFDGVVSGFLLRNVADLPQVLLEQTRMLSTNGSWAGLETTPPPANLLRPLLQFYLRWIIPALGRWLADDPTAYRYLPSSTEVFLTPKPMTQALRQAGLTKVGYLRKMLGTVAIYWGQPGSDS